MKQTSTLLLIGLLIGLAVSQSVMIKNIGCNSFDSNGNCLTCSARFYKDSTGICQPVNPNCNTFSQANGDCLTCYSGFGLIQGTCLPGLSTVFYDQNCNTFQGSICVKCSSGYYFGSSGKCTQADPSCLTFDNQNGACLSCYSGFALSNGKCSQSTTTYSDPNCNQFDNKGNCLKCSNGYYTLSLLGSKCVKVSDLCQTFDYTAGICKSCYAGYALNSASQCVVSQSSSSANPLCSKWTGSICNSCAQGSFFNSNGICTQVDSSCKTWDNLSGVCTSCYPGYSLSANSCVKSNNQTSGDSNCNQFDSNGNCVKCSTGFYFNSNSVCTQIDTNCQSFDSINKVCTACYVGYQLSSNQCIVNSNLVNSNPLCSKWNRQNCLSCAAGSFLNFMGICTQADVNCKTFNSISGACTSCYSGYSLSTASVCVKSTSQQVSDPNCNTFNSNGACTKCSTGFYFNLQSVCVQLDTNCQTFNQMTLACIQCYTGYALSNGACILDTSSQVNSNPFCSKWAGNTCLSCATDTYFNVNGICQQIDVNCKTFSNGNCIACYSGYQLVNQVCKVSVNTVSDPNCNTFNANGICTKCSSNAYFNDLGTCVKIDATCQTFDMPNRICTRCYPGFTIQPNGFCLPSVNSEIDPYCAQWHGLVCIQCSIGSVFNSSGLCQVVDPLCHTFDPNTGDCTTCYSGYSLDQNKVCQKSNIANANPLCSEWNQNICTKCSQGSYFGNNGLCITIDSSCKTANLNTGACTSCYSGYQLDSSSKCVNPTSANSNILCSVWANQICTQCSTGSYFNSAGICVTANLLCKTFNSMNGYCTSCFNGYTLSGNTCVISSTSSIDPFCKTFSGSVCIQCGDRYFKGQSGLCQQVNNLCNTWDSLNGNCLTCYPGYALSKGQCSVSTTQNSDPNCAQYSSNQLCLKCSSGYYFNTNGICTAVNPLCATYNVVSGQCLTCYNGYSLNLGSCVQTNSSNIDPNCALFSNNICTNCSKGFIFNSKGICTLINPLCKTYSQISGACLTCYNGYSLSGNNCIVDTNYQAGDPNCASYVSGICVKCVSRSFMNSKGICQTVNQNCQTYSNLNGACLTCYGGYSLNNGQCSQSQTINGCTQFDVNGNCLQCAQGSYLNANKCVQIDTQCANFNIVTKTCTGCYSGYTLLSGVCQISTVNEIYQVQNCVAYNSQNQCIQCYDRFSLSNNKCTSVSVFCKTYDSTTGLCKSCYSTFNLSNGQCLQ